MRLIVNWQTVWYIFNKMYKSLCIHYSMQLLMYCQRVRVELVIVNCCAKCIIYQFEIWVMLCKMTDFLTWQNFNKVWTNFKVVTIVTIQPNNRGYLVNNSYKMDAKWGHFSDKKLQNGYEICLGSYTKLNHNPVLNY